MSDSLIVAAEGSAPYKLLEDAGRGILTAEARAPISPGPACSR